MSGHSKWSTIKRQKGAADAKRGQLFTKLAREITIAARQGLPDPDAIPVFVWRSTEPKLPTCRKTISSGRYSGPPGQGPGTNTKRFFTRVMDPGAEP